MKHFSTLKLVHFFLFTVVQVISYNLKNLFMTIKLEIRGWLMALYTLLYVLLSHSKSVILTIVFQSSLQLTNLPLIPLEMPFIVNQVSSL